MSIQEVIEMVQRYVERHQIEDDDIVQELYLAALEEWKKGQNRQRVLLSINHRHRRMRVRDDKEIMDDEFYDFVDEVILKYEMARLIDKYLTPREKSVLQMEIDEDSGEYIAKTLGVTRGRVWQIRQKIFRTLRGKLKGF